MKPDGFVPPSLSLVGELISQTIENPPIILHRNSLDSAPLFQNYYSPLTNGQQLLLPCDLSFLSLRALDSQSPIADSYKNALALLLHRRAFDCGFRIPQGLHRVCLVDPQQNTVGFSIFVKSNLNDLKLSHTSLTLLQSIENISNIQQPFKVDPFEIEAFRIVFD